MRKTKSKRLFLFFSKVSVWILFLSCLDCKALAANIRLNEIYPYPETDQEEFIEIKNFGEEEVDLKDWTIKDAGNHSYTIAGATKLSPGKIVTFEKNFYLNNTGFEAVFLFDSEGEEVDGTSYENASQGLSWSFLDGGWNWSAPTKNQENEGNDDSEDDDPEEEIIYPNTIRLNEFFPNPEGDEKEEEFIELFNFSTEVINLKGWSIKDSSKSGEYFFPENSIISPQSFLVIYREEFNFALNNSGESLYLLNPNKEIIHEISFSGTAKEGLSFGYFNQNEWRWSSLLTPGEANQFKEFPSFKIEIPDNIFKNVYADFEVEIDDEEETSVLWNFGDNKTSRQRKSRHKYEKSKAYDVSLTLTGESEVVKKTFTIEVENFENEYIEIIALLPNPIGSDTDNEWVEIKNNGKKKVNLKNWILASGSSTLYNHPIKEDFIVKAHKSKKLYKESCAFSLGNKKTKIELRYPDGETADKVKYKEDKDITEGAIYKKTKSGWSWETVNSPIKEEEKEKEVTPPKSEPFLQENVVESSKKTIEGKSRKETFEINSIFEKKIQWELKNPPERVPLYGNFYSFTTQNSTKHWAFIFLDKINRLLNNFLLIFS